MPSTTNIPTTLRSPGSVTYGPVTLAAPDSDLQVNLDRTPAQGLNSVQDTVSVGAAFDMLLPGDPNWYQVGSTTFSGGPRVDYDTGAPLPTDSFGVSLWQPGLAGRQIRVRLTVGGASVRLAGTLVVT